MTAEYWQYNSRLGKRWNIDPVDQISISNFAVFRNSPIYFVDKSGNVTDGYTVDEQGNIERVNNTGGDKYDVLWEKSHYLEGKRSYDYKGTGNTGIRIDDKTFITNIRQEYEKVEISNTTKKFKYAQINSDQAVDVFKFLSDATSDHINRDHKKDIEWSLLQTYNGTYIGTSGSGSQVINWYWVNGFRDPSKYVIQMHSHPGKTYDAFQVSGDDIASAAYIRKHNPSAKFYVYMPELTKMNYNDVFRSKRNPDGTPWKLMDRDPKTKFVSY